MEEVTATGESIIVLSFLLVFGELVNTKELTTLFLVESTLKILSGLVPEMSVELSISSLLGVISLACRRLELRVSLVLTLEPEDRLLTELSVEAVTEPLLMLEPEDRSLTELLAEAVRGTLLTLEREDRLLTLEPEDKGWNQIRNHIF